MKIGKQRQMCGKTQRCHGKQRQMPIDTSWIEKQRETIECKAGVIHFLDFAIAHSEFGDKVKCPCVKCRNGILKDRENVLVKCPKCHQATTLPPSKTLACTAMQRHHRALIVCPWRTLPTCCRTLPTSCPWHTLPMSAPMAHHAMVLPKPCPRAACACHSVGSPWHTLRKCC